MHDMKCNNEVILFDIFQSLSINQVFDFIDKIFFSEN